MTGSDGDASEEADGGVDPTEEAFRVDPETARVRAAAVVIVAVTATAALSADASVLLPTLIGLRVPPDAIAIVKAAHGAVGVVTAVAAARSLDPSPWRWTTAVRWVTVAVGGYAAATIAFTELRFLSDAHGERLGVLAGRLLDVIGLR